MRKPTPGPWSVIAGGPWICAMGPNGKGATVALAHPVGLALVPGREEAEANAHLIAAAPDLYTALEHAINRNHEFSEGCSGCRSCSAALAKAEGK